LEQNFFLDEEKRVKIVRMNKFDESFHFYQARFAWRAWSICLVAPL
jgi:hypothetical protein